MNIYVGNLSEDVTEEELRTTFETYGVVTSVAIIKDRNTGQSRGFAFVEMPSQEEGKNAITGLNGKELKGRTLKVSEAYPKPQRKPFFKREGKGGERERKPRY
ncbi:MAG: RNA recognition motif domain-containing protein [Planctomycetota bacterium]